MHRIYKLYNSFRSNKTIINGSLFALFSFFNQGISFLILILIADYIVPSDYGRLSLFNTFVMFLGYFVALSSTGYLSVSYFRKNLSDFKIDVTSISVITISVTFIIFFIINVFKVKLSEHIGLPEEYLFIAVLISFFLVFHHLNLDYRRIRENVLGYGCISCSFAILNFIITFYLVINKNLSWQGRVYSYAICTILFGLFSVIYLLKQNLIVLRVKFSNIKNIIFWGVPLIPHLSSIWLKQGGDRLIIKEYHSMNEVGLFSFALNLMALIVMIGSAFNSSNSVSIYKILSSDKEINDKIKQLRINTRNITYIYVCATILIVLGGCFLVPILLPHYSGAIPYFVILSISGFLQCLYFLYCNYLFYYNCNKQLMKYTFFTSVIHLLLSCFLTKYSLYITCCIYVLTQFVVFVLVKKNADKKIKDELYVC